MEMEANAIKTHKPTPAGLIRNYHIDGVWDPEPAIEPEHGVRREIADKDDGMLRGQQTSLMLAAEKGSVPAVRALLMGATKESLEARDKAGRGTAFLHACAKGHVECMELLRDAGCDTSAVRSKGCNGMFLGVRHANVLKNLLEHDSLDINAREENLGMTPYLLACTTGRMESMNLLKAAGCDTKVRSFEGMTDLILAADQGHPDILQALLDDSEGKEQMNLEGESRPYLELRCKLGMTAFLYACANGNISCMGVLLRARADVTAKGADGRTALDFVLCSSCRDTGVHVLQGIGVNQTAPHTAPARLILKAAVYGDIVELQQLLDEAPENIDERGAYGHTAFHMSIILNQIDCMKALMKAGCDVTLKDYHNKTGLIYAATFGYAESVQILLDEGEGKGKGEGGDPHASRGVHTLPGAGLEVKDGEGGTAYLQACNQGQVEVIKMLRKAGADLTVTTATNSVTCLMLAVVRGHHEALRTILEGGGIDIEARDGGGKTAFLIAANTGQHECMAHLRDAGCNVHAVDDDKRTALMLSVIKGHPLADQSTAGLRALLNGGANLEDTDIDGATAFLLACQNPGYNEHCGMTHSVQLEVMELLMVAGSNMAAEYHDNLPSGLKTATDAVRKSGNEEAIVMLRDAIGTAKALQLKEVAEEFRAAGQWAEAKQTVTKALRLCARPTTEKLLLQLAATLEEETDVAHAEAVKVAARHEAELLASLEDRGSSQDQPNEAQAAKAQRKREKRRRQQEAKRRAAAAAATAAAELEAAAAVSGPDDPVEEEEER